MESPTSESQSRKALETAEKWNRQLAMRVARWKRLRLAVAVVFTAMGIALAFSGGTFIWAPPCFIAALIAYLLYLDSRDQLREIRSRTWATITPRIGRLKERTRQAAAKTTSPP